MLNELTVRLARMHKTVQGFVENPDKITESNGRIQAKKESYPINGIGF